MLADEELLLAVLNSAPVVDGVPTDDLEGNPGRGAARSWGGTGSTQELALLRHVRRALQSAIRGVDDQALHELGRVLSGTVQLPRLTRDGVVWELQIPDEDRLAVRVVLAWSGLMSAFPGRLRACANDECNLFLVDHSRPGTAKWCSMAVCGNRMKARTHARRIEH